MPDPVVWSERDEPGGGGWKDCTYSAGLMALVHAGEMEYPLGIYTAAEREALERSDNRPDETGANVYDLILATKVRYNREYRSPGANWTIDDLLDIPNACLILPGYLSNLPAGHWLRRWDPAFTGGHRIAVQTLRGRGFDEVRWLDPLATWAYPGDITNHADVRTFVKGMPIDQVRYTLLDEWVIAPAPPAPAPAPAPAPEPEPQPLPPAPDGTPFSQADLDAAVAMARRAEYERVVSNSAINFPPAP